MAKLEKHIRREWESTKDLPHVNIILEKIKEKEGYFNPKRYQGMMKKNLWKFFNNGK